MIERMDQVGIVVDDLAAATEFFVELAELFSVGRATVYRAIERHSARSTPAGAP